jgi:hypothetical protein
MLLPLLLMIALPLVCLTAIVLTACAWRSGAVRGSLRAGPVQFGIEIDPSRRDGVLPKAPGPEPTPRP